MEREESSKQETKTPAGYTEPQGKPCNLRLRWSWVEPEIWTDNMLTALENGVKGGKWFSLIDKVYSVKTLEKAWIKVRANKGAAGVDKVSITRFEEHKDKYLAEIQEDLMKGQYRPQAVRRVYIPKGNGKTRPLGIPTVKDRVIQTAAKMVLEPILEKEFKPSSYGFRPQIGAKDALREVDSLIKQGYIWYVDADLQSYFDTIQHKKLMEKLGRHVSDSRFLDLIELWLKQDIMEECKCWKPTEGSPQGAVISPLLANLYLHDLDVAMAEAGVKIVRYADDFVVLVKSKEIAEKVLHWLKQWAQTEELTIHPEKSHLGNCMNAGEGFDFLGYRFEGGERWIRKKSIQKFRDKIRELTKRHNGMSIEETIKRVNGSLKGWCNYFKHVTKWGLQTFDSFVRRRLRAILLAQNKRSGFGLSLQAHLRWSNAYFAKLGLYEMEAARQREANRSKTYGRA